MGSFTLCKTVVYSALSLPQTWIQYIHAVHMLASRFSQVPLKSLWGNNDYIMIELLQLILPFFSVDNKTNQPVITRKQALLFQDNTI